MSLTDAELDELMAAIGLRVPARSPQPCGTEAAYQRHLRRGENPCQECRDAHAAHHRKSCVPDPSRRKPIAHGTLGGAKQHRYRGEALCDPCRLAENAYAAERQRGYYQKARNAGGGS